MWQSPREWYQKMHDSRGASKNVAPLVYFHQSSFSFFRPAILEISNPMVLSRQAWFMCTSVHHCRRIGHDNFTLEKNLLGLYWLCIKLKTLFFLFLEGNKKGEVKCLNVHYATTGLFPHLSFVFLTYFPFGYFKIFVQSGHQGTDILASSRFSQNHAMSYVFRERCSVVY